jgi:hypothetical protein
MGAGALSTALIIAAMLPSARPQNEVRVDEESIEPPVRIAETYVAAAVSTPELRSTAAPRPRTSQVPTAGPRLARASVTASASSTKEAPISRKLTRFLTGDGRHTVRPFPTIGAQR